MGGAALDACAGRPMPSRAGPAAPIATTSTSAPVAHDQLATAQTPTGLLRIRNRPGMIGADTVRDYQLATGVTVDYYEDVLDDELWLTSERQALANRDDIGVDLVMLGDRAVRELLSAHRLESLDQDNLPDSSNLRRELAEPGSTLVAPTASRGPPGMAGIAYNTKRVARPVRGVGDLFDRRYKGRVTMLADPRDGLGMVMAFQGSSPAEATLATVTRAVDRVRIAARSGQIARFTGNADFADLVSGRMVMAQVRSGDMAGLRAANRNLAFVVPDAGSTLFARNMVVPDTSRNQVAAESWMNWIYDRPNYAAMISQVRATAVLSGLNDDLARISPRLAADPIVNPPLRVWARLSMWARPRRGDRAAVRRPLRLRHPLTSTRWICDRIEGFAKDSLANGGSGRDNRSRGPASAVQRSRQHDPYRRRTRRAGTPVPPAPVGPLQPAHPGARPRAADHRAGRRLLRLGQQRQPLPRRRSPGCSPCRPATAGSSWPRPRPSRPPSWPTSPSGPSPTRRPSSWPPAWPSWRPATSTASSSPPAGPRRSRSTWKLARQYFKAIGQPGRYKAIARNIAYHGVGMGALSLTGVPSMRAPFEPLVPGARHVATTNRYRCDLCAHADQCTLSCADDIERTIVQEGPESVAVVFLEPVQNAGGCFTPTPGYFDRVREICDRYGVLLVSDEVICAFGRLGTMFGAERVGSQPDMITMAKGITSGYSPLGGVMVSDRIAEPFLDPGRTFMHGITFAGAPGELRGRAGQPRPLRTRRPARQRHAQRGRLPPVDLAARGPAVGGRGPRHGLLLGRSSW